MVEAAGLALSVLGVAALFSTHVEALDLIVSARECSREYEELSSLVIWLPFIFIITEGFANMAPADS